MPTFPRAIADGEPISFTEVDLTCMSGRRWPDMFPPSTRHEPAPLFPVPLPIDGRRRAHVSPMLSSCLPGVSLISCRLVPERTDVAPIYFCEANPSRPVFPLSTRREPVLSSRFYPQPSLLCFPSDNAHGNTDHMFPYASADIYSKLQT